MVYLTEGHHLHNKDTKAMSLKSITITKIIIYPLSTEWKCLFFWGWLNALTFDLSLKSVPKNLRLDFTVIKAFTDDNIMSLKLLFVYDRIENMVGKGENAGYHHFLLFQ